MSMIGLSPSPTPAKRISQMRIPDCRRGADRDAGSIAANRAPRKCILLITCTLIASTALGKAPVRQIDIAADSMAAPIEITEPNVVGKFNIWNGPGVRVNGKPVHLDPANQEGYFINWPKGTTEPPDQALMFDVTFRLGHRDSDPREWSEYRVTYAFRPGDAGGYIYLPEKNVRLISHGVEGNWFCSTDTWEALIRPIIEREGKAANGCSRTRHLSPRGREAPQGTR